MKNGMKYFVKTLVEPTLDFDSVGVFQEGLAAVCNKKGIGFIDKTGKPVIPVGLYDNINRQAMINMWYIFREGLSAMVKDGKCGFMGKSGNIVIPPEYDTVSWFREGLAAARKDGKWGFINKTGKTVIPFEYDFVQQIFREGLAGVQKDGKFGYIDKTGEVIIPLGLKYDCMDPFQEGVARVVTGRGEMPNFPQLENESKEEFLKRSEAAIEEATKNERWGFIDRTGKLLLPLEYSYLSPLCEGLTISVKDGHISYIDKMGNTPFLTPHFDRMNCFREGFASVKKDGKWGCIDKSGELVIPLAYDNDFIIIFSEGFAAVKVNDKWGYIDKTGKVAVPLEYDHAEPVCEGLAVVRKDDKWGIFQIEEND
jgi:hypothetical protein